MTGNDIPKTYDYIVKHFGESVIADRYDWLYGMLKEYIESRDLGEKTYISEDILNHVIIDYYVDIYRLKDFQDIEHTNHSKIFSYLSFWCLRHKPIQLLCLDMEKDVFINEQFVAEMLRMMLFDNPSNIAILKEKSEDIKEFLETLEYYFKYRDYSAKGIEMIILAFMAGRGYQYSVDHKF